MKKLALILAIALCFALLASCTPEAPEEKGNEEKQEEQVKNEETKAPDETIGETVDPEDEFPWEGDPVETPIIDPNGKPLEIIPDENELPAIPIE